MVRLRPLDGPPLARQIGVAVLRTTTAGSAGQLRVTNNRWCDEFDVPADKECADRTHHTIAEYRAVVADTDFSSDVRALTEPVSMAYRAMRHLERPRDGTLDIVVSGPGSIGVTTALLWAERWHELCLEVPNAAGTYASPPRSHWA
ncbi:hypothetical protein [Streptomyces sp. NPDC096311]|uniref:hypothetical protein n=1 Tax=Streptomyces sp. NPDC096311 TaxID=3366083 RepID=UPI003810638C